MYLILVAFGFCAVYAFLLFLYSLFFKNAMPVFRPRFGFSVVTILAVYGAVAFTVGSLEDLELGNRILHVFGGGFLAFLVCFLVVKDLHLEISRFRFVVFSFLVVLGLGVGNEILEYFLQNYTSLSFATSANDTWMDLMSNVIGAVIGTICLTPWIRSKAVE